MRLSDWIKKEGLRRVDVARALGVSRSYVTVLCSGKGWPSREVALKVARLTRGAVAPDDFLWSKDR